MFICTSILLRKTLVVHPHGMADRKHNELWHLPKQLNIACLNALSPFFTVRFLNQNEKSSSHLSPSSCSIMPNLSFVTLAEKSFNPHSQPSLNLESVDSPSLNCVYVGRLHRKKRVYLQIEAINILRQQGLAVSLTIIGPDDGELSSLKSLVKRLHITDSIKFLGAVAYGDISYHLRKYHLLLLTSSNEGDPMTIRDALINKVPVFLTDTLAHMQDLAPQAILVSESTPQSIASSLRQLISHPEKLARLLSAAKDSSTILCADAQTSLLRFYSNIH